MRNGGRAEAGWKWVCRGLAIVGFLYLLSHTTVQDSIGFYILMIGLFFGPEAIQGQLKINQKTNGG